MFGTSSLRGFKETAVRVGNRLYGKELTLLELGSSVSV